MLKSLVKALGCVLYKRKRSVGFIAGLVFSGAACALGMGGISVITALGEPLKADIELIAVGKAEKDSLTARLASPEVFKSAGVDYPSGIPQLKFKIETRAEGGKYIRVTSVEPLNEPFVSILVELNWPSGKLLREYTFLLDPPGFRPELVKEAEVKPIVPSVAPAPEPKPEAVKIEVAPLRATAPVDEKVFAAPAKKPAAKGGFASGNIKVNRGDTLTKIANQMKPADVSLERMLVALYRANAEVFDSKNMNRLRYGKILRMPDQSELDNLTQTDSVMEIRAQAVDWNAYRQKLAAASMAVTERAPRQEASGKVSATVADKAPAAKESAKEVVRLSKGEAPGDKAAGGGSAKALQDKDHQEEESIAKSKALKESGERIAMLEKNAKAMQRLIELKGQSAAKPEAKPEPPKFSVKPEAPAPVVVASASAVEPVSAVSSAGAVQPAKPAVKQVAKPKPVAPPPSLLDEILGEPLYLAGGAAVLLALGGLALARRRKAGAFTGAKMEEEGGASSRILAPATSSPETGDFTGAATSTVAANVAQSEEVDPISEAELFLNFGRDAQAEEILKDALGRNPSNLAVMLKLMSIYANRKDVSLFSSYAHQVKDSGDAAAWEKAAEMGRKLEPDNPLYGGEGSEQVTQAAPDAVVSEQPAPVVDFDLGLDTPEAAPLPGASSGEKAVSISEVDFDLGFEEPKTPLSETTMIMSSGELPQGDEIASEEEKPEQDNLSGDQATSLDFDVTATNPGLPVAAPDQTEAEAVNLDEMVIDLADATPSSSFAAEEAAVAPVPENSGKDDAFMLDFPVDNKSADAPARFEIKKAMEIDLSDISLDLDEPEAPAAAPVAEVRDTNWHDVATKLDLAKAYQEMGDAAGAREILDEVVREGDAQQREAAEAILKQLPA